MTPIVLTPQELKALTGASQAQAQIDYLRANGWRFELDRDGRPVVARGYFDRRMGCVDEVRIEGSPGHHNFAALKG